MSRAFWEGSLDLLYSPGYTEVTELTATTSTTSSEQTLSADPHYGQDFLKCFAALSILTLDEGVFFVVLFGVFF